MTVYATRHKSSARSFSIWAAASYGIGFRCLCLATFQRKPNRELDAWNCMVEGEIGVSQVLACELHQLMPGDHTDLLRQAGIHLLETNFPGWAGKRPPKGKTAPIKSAHESSVKSGVSRLL